MTTRARPLPTPFMTALHHGAAAGIGGGLAIAAIGMASDAALGIGFWALPNAIGGLALGVSAGESRDLGVVTIAGVLLHVAFSASFGIGIEMLRRLTHESLLIPVAIGLALWIFDYDVVGAISPRAHAVATLNPSWLGGALHAVFGLVTGLLGRRLAR